MTSTTAVKMFITAFTDRLIVEQCGLLCCNALQIEVKIDVVD
jgi:hypothetical protein